MKQRPSELNRQYLHTRLRYESGKLFWREKPEKDNRTGWNKKYAGKEAGGINDDGYWKIKIDGRWFRRHRLVWAMHYGDAGITQIDHIDGQRSNDRIENLRTATPQQNAFNRKNQSNNPTGAKGITRKNGKFCASVVVGKKPHFAGFFNDFSEAKAAVKSLRESLHGGFCNHGEKS